MQSPSIRTKPYFIDLTLVATDKRRPLCSFQKSKFGFVVEGKPELDKSLSFLC